MSSDLIAVFCQGCDPRFQRRLCEFYQQIYRECHLLKEFILQAVFEKGRCLPEKLLRTAIAVNLLEYAELVRVEEYLDALTFESAERLKLTRLQQGFNLAVLKGYINVAAYRNVRETLEKDGILQKRICGHCLYLSPYKPTICQRETITTGEGDLPHELFEQSRFPSDRGCKHGFEPLTFESTEGKEPFEVETDAQRVMVVAKFLQDRIAQAQGEAKKRCDRQYLVFCHLVHWLGHTTSWDDEKTKLAATLGISIKTVDRDIQELVDILEEHDVLS
ncbi:hypothetical protein U14_02335 [Candidatus Moduliflexus flocculans]|uniref:Uncharacterized protein n=1 Tax=Candidatus Moduliflexus flocculans TaxID=1499966 RepID=A0A0S6VU57_9BACT|nr:hypothetical protein U14_02335 [Candidatus Moduliflexus flocculans]